MSKIEARIDKWLWAVRVFKTRTIAADACKKGRVMMAGAQVKPSRVVRPLKNGSAETLKVLTEDWSKS